ncbi:MAG: glycosyltransferase family 1 protein [bacterium]|nr:glycosyltransferase family 1 protein [bacterium]
MIIGIDARTLGTSRALGRYIRNLLVEFSRLGTLDEFVIFVDQPSVKVYESLGINDDRWCKVLTPPRKLLRDHLFFATLADRHHLDVFFHPDNLEFLRMPLPSVVTIHDLMPYKFPDLILSQNPIKKIWQKAYFAAIASALKSNTSGIMTVSEHTKRDVISTLGISEDRIRVIYEGVEENFLTVGRVGVPEEQARAVLAHYQITWPYIFYLGGLNRHKNVSTLVSAYALVVKNGLQAKLVIGGKTTADTSTGQNVYLEVLEQIKNLGLTEQVIFTGYITDEHLPILYHQALVYVFPSLYEGFGFGPLEAMASGCPVIASNAASLPEVVGEAGILIAPDDVGGFASAIQRVSNDESFQKDLRQKGLMRAEKFSWRQCASETLAFLEKAANG